MKGSIIVWMVICLSLGARAEMIVLKASSSDVTTGELLDGTRDAERSVGVQEISGLQITARSGAANQELNATTSGFGINTDDISDDTDAFEYGEEFIFSFDTAVTINRFDFYHFDADEIFLVTVGTNDTIEITYDDLTNKTSDYFDSSLWIEANTDVRFSVSAGSVIGLDGIDVIPEPRVYMLIACSGAGLLFIRRFLG